MVESPTKAGVNDYGSKEATSQAVTTDGDVPVSVLEDGSLDPVYEAKAKVLNKAIQDIGMGRYQWQVSVTKYIRLRRLWNMLFVYLMSPPLLSAFSIK
jgi:hypothetical protein